MKVNLPIFKKPASLNDQEKQRPGIIVLYVLVFHFPEYFTGRSSGRGFRAGSGLEQIALGNYLFKLLQGWKLGKVIQAEMNQEFLGSTVKYRPAYNLFPPPDFN